MESNAQAFSNDAPTPPSSPEIRNERLTFTGSGGEYFRIWIVNLLLTVVTLGIYSAWAKVRRLRYFYGNTQLAGSSFEYHGQPMQILKGRLIAVAALAVYVVCTRIQPLSFIVFLPLMVFGVPWVIVRSRMFQMYMSSWRGIRFGFHGKYRQALSAYIGWLIVAAMTLYMLVPVWLQRRVKFLLGNTRYGTEPFVFEKSPGPYFRFYFAMIGMGILAAIAVFAIMAVTGLSGMLEGGEAAMHAAAGRMALAMLPIAAIYLFMILVLGAYYQSSFTNANFDQLRIGAHRVRSQLRTGPLAWLNFTNFLGIVFTLGLFWPWAAVRTQRYKLEQMHVEAAGSLDEFAAAAGTGGTAVGEEMGDIFDVDLGL